MGALPHFIDVASGAQSAAVFSVAAGPCVIERVRHWTGRQFAPADRGGEKYPHRCRPGWKRGRTAVGKAQFLQSKH